jgi:hypothetical protein
MRSTGGIRRVRVELGGSMAATRGPLSATAAGAYDRVERQLVIEDREIRTAYLMPYSPPPASAREEGEWCA